MPINQKQSWKYFIIDFAKLNYEALQYDIEKYFQQTDFYVILNEFDFWYWSMQLD